MRSAYADLYNNYPYRVRRFRNRIYAQNQSSRRESTNRRVLSRSVSDSLSDYFDLYIGCTLQTDYRYYEEDCREDNRFDIRRAKLSLFGHLQKWIQYGLSFEFQGSEQKNLVDAFGEIAFHQSLNLKFGQFKVPFSLEWQTQDKAILFAERSMGYYLTPSRDVGIITHGSLLNHGLYYYAGIFNGDGTDGSSRGSQSDDPEFSARIGISPFIRTSWKRLQSFHIGGSVTHAHIDLTNVNLEVKTTGMAGTSRSIYKFNANTKFGVLRGVHRRLRHAFETAWTLGPVAIQGEYIKFRFTDLEPAGTSPQGAEFYTWYGSAIFFLTCERLEFEKGALQPVTPIRNFNPDTGDIGAIGIAFRWEHFSGDENWIMQNVYASVREADAFSVALNWIMTPFFGLILDYTKTNLSDPIRVRVNPKDGSIDYIEKEHVITTRFNINF